MQFLRNLSREQNLWPRVALIISIGFLVLTVVVWLLGYRVLSDSEDRVLEQRLNIAQLVANQIDILLEETVLVLEEVTLSTSFNPADPDLDPEARALEVIGHRLGSTITGVFFLDHQGNVILANPPEDYPAGTDLSSSLYISQGLSRQDSYISAPHQTNPEGSVVAAVVVPVTREARNPGFLVTLIDLHSPIIRTSLNDAVALGKTAHAVLVDELGRSIFSTFELPHLSPGEHVTFYRRAISEGQPVVEEVPFELDFPGEPLGHHHIMAFVPLKRVPWGVSIGGDVGSETFAGVWRLFFGLAVLSLFAVGLIWGGLLLTTRRLLTPVGDTILKFDFSQRIANIKEWDELIRYIVRLPSKIAPVSGSRLTLLDRDSGMVELVSEWSKDGNTSGLPPFPKQSYEICETCYRNDKSAVHSLVPCTYQEWKAPPDGLNCFCLPLVHQESVVGTLHFAIPHDVPLIRNQVDILTSLTQDMAMAIESFQLYSSTLKEAEITQLERQRIARYLHDTLGQNVSYLRMKLDQLGNESTTQDITEIQQSLKQMGTIANEAYEQIRVSMLELQSDTQADLEIALQSKGKSIADQNRLAFELTSEGKPVKLPQNLRRRVLFICTEALNNIEQHANAQKISINLQWKQRELTIAIHDDGSGFDTSKHPPNGHFGIDIMYERAQMIGGQVSVTSEPGFGTTVALWLPILQE